MELFSHSCNGNFLPIDKDVLMGVKSLHSVIFGAFWSLCSGSVAPPSFIETQYTVNTITLELLMLL